MADDGDIRGGDDAFEPNLRPKERGVITKTDVLQGRIVPWDYRFDKAKGEWYPPESIDGIKLKAEAEEREVKFRLAVEDRANSKPTTHTFKAKIRDLPTTSCSATTINLEEPEPPRKFTVIVARFPGQNQEHPASSDWVIGAIRKMDKEPRIEKVGRFTKSDTPITMVRNMAVKTAQESKADYLLMIDSDMDPDIILGTNGFWESTWAFMLDRRDAEDRARAEGVDGHKLFELYPPATVAAPYCGPSPMECVYVFQWTNQCSGEQDTQFKLQMIPREDAARRRGIEVVAALPTGLILYDMRVFDHLAPPWFDYEWTDKFQNQKASTEDVFQTRNASMMGMPQYCNWDAWAGHIKLKTVGPPRPLQVGDVQSALRKAFSETPKNSEKTQANGS